MTIHSRTSYERATRQCDAEFQRRLTREIINAIAEARIVTDPDVRIMALRTGETLEALALPRVRRDAGQAFPPRRREGARRRRARQRFYFRRAAARRTSVSISPAIDYATLARLRAGARSKMADVICPVCSATRTGAAAKRKVLRTWVKQSAIGFHCVRCDIDGLAFADNEEVEIPPAYIEDDDGEERKRHSNLELADRIWRQSFKIAGTAGEAYLLRRGIVLEDVPDFGGLRWHPQCLWDGGTTPCVLARFTDAITAAPRGIWRRPIDGRKPKTLGPMRGCVIRLWRDCDVTNGLVLGEGVETTLSAGTRFVHRNTLLRPAWAAGSAGNLENFPVLSIEALTLLVDHDKSNRGQEAARRCGERWQDAGREVSLLTPRNIGDFNDLVRP